MAASRRRIRPVEVAVVAAATMLVVLGWAHSYPGGADSAEADTSGGSFRVAAVQMYSRMGDLSYNRARMSDMVRRAAAAGARVIVFPEAALTGYMSIDGETWTDPVARPGEGRSLQDCAEPVNGKSVRLFSGLARELEVYVAVPFIEYDRAGGKYYNSVVLVGPDGGLAAHYRKLNPWPGAEATWASRGDLGAVCADTPYGRLGILICYDMHSLGDKLAESGADTLLYPVAWPGRPRLWFEERLPAKAQSMGVNVIAANWSFPRKPSFGEGGFSRVISAEGEVLASAEKPESEGLVIADLRLPAGD